MHTEVGAPGGGWGPLADRAVFDELRLDPFYRTVATAHPGLEGRLRGLIDEALDPPERAFVHADFSPKNLLVLGRAPGLIAVDFETAHAGDPAFDVGFFASHLLLKAVRAAPRHGPFLHLIDRFFEAYGARTRQDMQAPRLRRAAAHAAACALARVDGKSPVDYLDEPRREAVRRFASATLATGTPGWGRLLEDAGREMRRLAEPEGVPHDRPR